MVALSFSSKAQETELDENHYYCFLFPFHKSDGGDPNKDQYLGVGRVAIFHRAEIRHKVPRPMVHKSSDDQHVREVNGEGGPFGLSFKNWDSLSQSLLDKLTQDTLRKYSLTFWGTEDEGESTGEKFFVLKSAMPERSNYLEVQGTNDSKAFYDNGLKIPVSKNLEFHYVKEFLMDGDKKNEVSSLEVGCFTQSQTTKLLEAAESARQGAGGDNPNYSTTLLKVARLMDFYNSDDRKVDFPEAVVNTIGREYRLQDTEGIVRETPRTKSK